MSEGILYRFRLKFEHFLSLWIRRGGVLRLRIGPSSTFHSSSAVPRRRDHAPGRMSYSTHAEPCQQTRHCQDSSHRAPGAPDPGPRGCEPCAPVNTFGSRCGCPSDPLLVRPRFRRKWRPSSAHARGARTAKAGSTPQCKAASISAAGSQCPRSYVSTARCAKSVLSKLMLEQTEVGREARTVPRPAGSRLSR